MGLIYLDSCIVIYAFEDETELGERVRQRLADSPGSTFAISPLVAMECLTQPLRQTSPVLAHYYDEGLATFENLTLDQRVFRRAAELRASSRLKTPDALHLAVAQVHRCDELWTNDDRLSAASGGLAIAVTG